MVRQIDILLIFLLNLKFLERHWLTNVRLWTVLLSFTLIDSTNDCFRFHNDFVCSVVNALELYVKIALLLSWAPLALEVDHYFTFSLGVVVWPRRVALICLWWPVGYRISVIILLYDIFSPFVILFFFNFFEFLKVRYELIRLLDILFVNYFLITVTIVVFVA